MKHQKLDELYSDDDIVVVNKPTGLLSIPDRFDTELPNVRNILRDRYGTIFVVHRLDRETSGVMIMAKPAEAHKHLSEQFEHHTVKKLYHAIVSGIIEPDTLPINISIGPDPRRKGLMKPTARGKAAHTVVRVVERFRVATLVECELITGRQHQIRVHCAAVGHPLFVDADYGRAKEFMLSSIKRKFNLAKNTEERPVIARVTLHAHALHVNHPTTDARMAWEAPYPKDFAATLQVLRKYAAPYASRFDDVEFF
jgi:RluA family pseudouridine synthase